MINSVALMRCWSVQLSICFSCKVLQSMLTSLNKLESPRCREYPFLLQCYYLQFPFGFDYIGIGSHLFGNLHHALDIEMSNMGMLIWKEECVGSKSVIEIVYKLINCINCLYNISELQLKKVSEQKNDSSISYYGLTSNVKLQIINTDGGLLMKDNLEGGRTWAYEVGSQSMVCPIIVEDLNRPRQMLVEVLTTLLFIPKLKPYPCAFIC